MLHTLSTLCIIFVFLAYIFLGIIITHTHWNIYLRFFCVCKKKYFVPKAVVLIVKFIRMDHLLLLTIVKVIINVTMTNSCTMQIHFIFKWMVSHCDQFALKASLCQSRDCSLLYLSSCNSLFFILKISPLCSLFTISSCLLFTFATWVVFLYIYTYRIGCTRLNMKSYSLFLLFFSLIFVFCW